MKYRVKFLRPSLSPPNTFDTPEQAHEFFLGNRDEGENVYLCEEVRLATLGDLITELDLTSAMRENAQRLFRDDSLLDTPAFLAKQANLASAVQDVMDGWGMDNGVLPEGMVVVRSNRVMLTP